MKCGMELLALAKQAEEQKKLKAIADAKAAEERQRKLVKSTIYWCDTVLSDYLEKAAMQGDLTTKDFFFNRSGISMWFHGYAWTDGSMSDFQPLKLSSKQYANGDRSYTEGYPHLDVETIIDYCKEHCVLVQIERANYKSYGWGVRDGFRLGFKLSPECI